MGRPAYGCSAVGDAEMRKEERAKMEKGIYVDEQIRRELYDRGYLNLSPIGKGTFSEVLRVWDERHGGFLACKVSRMCEQTEREAHMLKMLKHPIFPRYVGSWKCQDRHCLLMEYVCGSNLKELLRRRGRFVQEQAVYIAMELAQGLIFLHERSEPILFRDIKPDNVMIRQDGRVKLVDVGCACLMKEGGTIAGNRGYSAPEQFKPTEKPGVESDIYALGKLLYYMLTGDEMGKSKSGTEGERLYYKGISHGLLQLVEQAIQDERQMRIPDIKTFVKQLAIYNKKHSLQKLCTDAKVILHHGEMVDFYYMQYVHLGVDKN